MFDNKKNNEKTQTNNNTSKPQPTKKNEFYDSFDIKEQNEAHLYKKPEVANDTTIDIQKYKFNSKSNDGLIKTINVKDVKDENKLVALKMKRKGRDKQEPIDESTISGRNKMRMRLDAKPYFVVSGITKEFKNGSGVRNVTFSIQKGEMVGFIGDNGTGKTTTIKMIFNELIKDAGFVSLEGEQATHKNVLSRIAFFPDQNNYPKNFNIVKFAYYCAALKGVEKLELDKYIDLYLEALTLKPYAKNKFSDLSAGMQKKALLLSVLVTNPEIIVLDEPTANLDVYSRLEFMGVLKHLSTVYGKTIVITSHNIDELNNSVNRAILLKKIDGYGQLVYDEPFNKDTQDLRKIYIDVVGREIKGIDYDKIKNVEDKKQNAKYEQVFSVKKTKKEKKEGEQKNVE